MADTIYELGISEIEADITDTSGVYISVFDAKRDIMVLEKRGGTFLPSDVIDSQRICLNQAMGALKGSRNKIIDGSVTVETVETDKILTISGTILIDGWVFKIPSGSGALTLDITGNTGVKYIKATLETPEVVDGSSGGEVRLRNNFWGSVNFGKAGANRLVTDITLEIDSNSYLEGKCIVVIEDEEIVSKYQDKVILVDAGVGDINGSDISITVGDVAVNDSSDLVDAKFTIDGSWCNFHLRFEVASTGENTGTLKVVVAGMPWLAAPGFCYFKAWDGTGTITEETYATLSPMTNTFTFSSSADVSEDGSLNYTIEGKYPVNYGIEI